MIRKVELSWNDLHHSAAACDTKFDVCYLLSLLGFFTLAISFFVVLFFSNGILNSTAFAVLSLSTLLLLFWNLRLFEKAEQNSVKRDRIKIPVWLLSTLLIVMFTFRVSFIMPLPVKIVIWALSGATIVVGFYFFFLHQEMDAQVHDSEDDDSKLQSFKEIHGGSQV